MATRLVRLTAIEVFVLAVLVAAGVAAGVWWYGRARGLEHLETMKDDLRNFAAAQQAYAADNGGMFMPRNSGVTTTVPYNGYAPSQGVTVSIAEPGPGSWSATATHKLAPGRTCGMFLGEPPAAPNPATLAGEPACN